MKFVNFIRCGVASSIFCYALTTLASGQSTADPSTKTPEQLKQTLLAVRSAFGLQPTGGTPYHVKAHFNTFDAEGKPDGTGTFEEFADGKARLRADLTYRGVTQTIWRNAAEYRKGGPFPSSYFMRHLVGGFERPVAPASALQSNTFTDQQQNIGSVSMHCIHTRAPLPAEAKAVPVGVYGPSDEQAYCLSDGDRYLRVQQNYPGVTLVFNKLHSFTGQAVPYTAQILQRNMLRGVFEVDTLEAWVPDDATLAPAADAKESIMSMASDEVQGGSTGLPAGSLQAFGGTMESTAISRRPPRYPPFAKNAKIQGTVILSGVINKQGTVAELEVLTSPAPSLSEAALEAVQGWQYKPFVVNGQTFQVTTTISVNFLISPTPSR